MFCASEPSTHPLPPQKKYYGDFKTKSPLFYFNFNFIFSKIVLKSTLLCCCFLSQPYTSPPFTFPSYINEAFNIAKPFACKIACLFLNNCIYFNYVFESYRYCFDIA